MAYFHTNVLDPQIKVMPTIDTASGSVATFDTDMTENLVECVCDIMYSQASGTPTPSSPIPITVYNALNLSHSGADTSNPTIINIPFGQTVAKGLLNVLSGVLTIDWAVLDIGTTAWVLGSGGSSPSGKIFRTTDAIAYLRERYTENDVKCSIFGSDSSYWFVSNVENYNMMVSNAGYIYVRDDDYDNDINGFKTALNGIKIAYKLETPLRVALTPNQVTALLNENNIWCDTNGDTSVKYLLSVGKKIN